MPSIYDIYEFYLEARDLKDKAHVVTIESVKLESVFNPQNSKKDSKICLRFVNRRKAMLLNKTQAGAVEEIAKTDDYTKWKGVEVVLVSGRAKNGKQTIIITDRANSGDVDLMYPPPSPKVEKKIVPAGFWDVREMGGPAVKLAAARWGVSEAVVWGMLDRAVKDEELGDVLPENEFREYVEKLSIFEK
jgi:hypothetical protein